MKFSYSKQFSTLIVSLFFVTSVFAQSPIFANWSLSCKNNNPCFISQKITLNLNDKVRVLGGASIFYTTENLVIRLRFPPNAKQSHGVGIKVDKNNALHLPITACDDKVCEANIAIDKQLLAELKAGDLLSIAFFDKKLKQKTLPIFLSNFNEVFNQLTEKNRSLK